MAEVNTSAYDTFLSYTFFFNIFVPNWNFSMISYFSMTPKEPMFSFFFFKLEKRGGGGEDDVH